MVEREKRNLKDRNKCLKMLKTIKYKLQLVNNDKMSKNYTPLLDKSLCYGTRQRFIDRAVIPPIPNVGQEYFLDKGLKECHAI